MRRVRLGLAAVLCCLAWPIAALDLALPSNASETASRDQTLARYAVPVGAFENGDLPAEVFEGPVRQRAYRIASPGLTPLQILAPLRSQLEEAGYEVLLDCDEARCGGFDFRFAIDVLPAPNMYVNIRGYHFLSARTVQGDAAVTLLASAAAGAAYLQIVQIGEQTGVVLSQPLAGEATGPGAATTAPTGDTAAHLLQKGHVVLQTLDFAVGTTTLSTNGNAELADIAALMEARSRLRIAIVGHTDTLGSLDANIAISRARAESVRQVLLDQYGVAGDRVEAEGMGYLSPVASNLTVEGREANRRVEVVVVSEEE